MTDTVSRPIRTRNGLLLILAGTAGYIDALSYLGLGRVFVANMTGNTVLLGIAVAQLDGEAALRAGLALVGFLGGAVIATGIVQRDRSTSLWPATVTFALAAELIILMAFTAGWQLAGDTLPAAVATALLIVLSALAMGIQSAAIHRLQVSGVATTYITGTLTNFIVQLMEQLRRRHTAVVRYGDQHEPLTHGAPLLAAVWIVYLSGAGIAAAGSLLEQQLMPAVPAVLLMFVVVMALLTFRHCGRTL